MYKNSRLSHRQTVFIRLDCLNESLWTVLGCVLHASVDSFRQSDQFFENNSIISSHQPLFPSEYDLDSFHVPEHKYGGCHLCPIQTDIVGTQLPNFMNHLNRYSCIRKEISC